MKKLMVLAAVAAMGALGAKAEMMDPTLENYTPEVKVYFATGTSKTDIQGYTQYYFVTASDYNTWWGGGHEDINTLANVIYSGSLEYRGDFNRMQRSAEDSAFRPLSRDQALALAGGITQEQAWNNGITTISAGTSYAVIYNPTTHDAFGIANDSYNMMYSQSGPSEVLFVAQPTYNNQGSPAAVPEPTSGLLLLLGVAGLALKRKRA